MGVWRCLAFGEEGCTLATLDAVSDAFDKPVFYGCSDRPLEQLHLGSLREPTARGMQGSASFYQQHKLNGAEFYNHLEERIKHDRRPIDGVGLAIPYHTCPHVRKMLKGFIQKGLNEAAATTSIRFSPNYRELRCLEIPLALWLQLHPTAPVGNGLMGIANPGVGLPGVGNTVELCLLQRRGQSGPEAAASVIWVGEAPLADRRSLANLLREHPQAGQAQWFAATPQIQNQIHCAAPAGFPTAVLIDDWQDQAARGTARFLSQTLSDSRTVSRIAPRPVGLFCRNSSGELFWRRLWDRGDPCETSMQISLDASGIVGTKPELNCAALTGGAPAFQWIVCGSPEANSAQFAWWSEVKQLDPWDGKLLRLQRVCDDLGPHLA